MHKKINDKFIQNELFFKKTWEGYVRLFVKMKASIDLRTMDQQSNNSITALQTIILIRQKGISFLVYRQHIWHELRIVGCYLSPKSVRGEIKEKLWLKITLSFSYSHVLQNPLKKSRTLFS